VLCSTCLAHGVEENCGSNPLSVLLSVILLLLCFLYLDMSIVQMLPGATNVWLL